MTYQYPGKDSVGERYQGGRWWAINNDKAPEAAVASAISSAAQEEPTFPLADCSTTQFICVRTFHRVFAMPRDKIEVGEKYVVAGAHITVEGCLRKANDECTVALLISDCRLADRMPRTRAPVGEIVGKDCQLSGWGEQIIFIFDRRRGVIAYEEADWWKPGTDISRWDLSTLGSSAGLMALVESKGLLSCEMSSRD